MMKKKLRATAIFMALVMLFSIVLPVRASEGIFWGISEETGVFTYISNDGRNVRTSITLDGNTHSVTIVNLGNNNLLLYEHFNDVLAGMLYMPYNRGRRQVHLTRFDVNVDTLSSSSRNQVISTESHYADEWLNSFTESYSAINAESTQLSVDTVEPFGLHHYSFLTYVWYLQEHFVQPTITHGPFRVMHQHGTGQGNVSFVYIDEGIMTFVELVGVVLLTISVVLAVNPALPAIAPFASVKASRILAALSAGQVGSGFLIARSRISADERVQFTYAVYNASNVRVNSTVPQDTWLHRYVVQARCANTNALIQSSYNWPALGIFFQNSNNPVGHFSFAEHLYMGFHSDLFNWWLVTGARWETSRCDCIRGWYCTPFALCIFDPDDWWGAQCRRCWGFRTANENMTQTEINATTIEDATATLYVRASCCAA